jgi:hypothetical protein
VGNDYIKTKSQLDVKAIMALANDMTDSATTLHTNKMMSAATAGAFFTAPLLVAGLVV